MSNHERNKKKGFCAVVLLILLASQASAVKLEYTRFFPECSFHSDELSFTNVFRCGCYFFIPNAHLEAGYDLIIAGTGDAVYQLLISEIDNLIKFFTNLLPIDEIKTLFDEGLTNIFPNLQSVFTHFLKFTTYDFMKTEVLLLLDLTIAPFTLIFDVGSNIIVYLILLIFEFVKTYLFWILVPISLWNMVLFGLAIMMHQKYSFMGNFVFNPAFMAIAISVLVLVGSILLITMDIGVFNMRFI